MEDNKDNDNIYVYTEDSDEDGNKVTNGFGNNNSHTNPQSEEEKDIDQSKPNFAQYEYNESEGTGGNSGTSYDYNGVSVFGLLLKTLLNPLAGWKAVRRYKITPEVAQHECFYPLLAFYAISKFAILAYSSKADLSEVIVDAVTAFVSFFFGYFCILMLLKNVMPRIVAEQFETNFGKTLVVFSLSSLCLFFIFTELLPMLWAVLIFLPLWTVYMICRAARFLKVPEERHVMTLGLLNIIIIGMPALLEYVFGLLLPK